MFLDTDVSLFREWRIEKLADSPYTVPELQQILVDEVYPVCGWNLFIIAGEWAGFDMNWLEGRILRKLRSPLRLFHWFNLGRLTIHLSLEWRATKRGINAIRESHGGKVT
jgi:hypothetical protein